MKEFLSGTEFGAVSVAQYVALRKLDSNEIDAILQKDPDLLDRVSTVMSRVSFIDELRYSVELDLTDLIQCMRRDALETYLLCTCFDTLSGRANYFDLQSWLKADKTTGLGIAERKGLIQKFEATGCSFSGPSFSAALSQILGVYNQFYGVNQNIRQLVQFLPEEIKDELALAYTIYKESTPKGEETWHDKTVDDKLKVIFVEYLLQYRRNLYTHESRSFMGFGGISQMRQSLRDGKIDLPKEEQHKFRFKRGYILVTCHYGDEALFLRETIIACLAHKLGLLTPGWRQLYDQAERQKRTLYALLYELRYNIQIMQLHLQVLSEPLVIHASDDSGSPKLQTRIAQSLVEKSSQTELPVSNYFLEEYIKAAKKFNSAIDETGANTKLHMESTSQDANALMVDSGIRWCGKTLWKICEQMLETYPAWTYSPICFPLPSW